MYYKHGGLRRQRAENHGGLRRQRAENQAFISLHLQADQIRKSFNTNVVSLNN